MSYQGNERDEETGLQEPLLTLHSIAEESEGSRGTSSHGTRSDSPFAAFASQSSMSNYGSHSLDRRAMNREASKLNPQLRHSQSLSATDVREWQAGSQSRDSIGSAGEARSNWRRAGNKVMGRPEMSRMLSQLLHQPGQLQGIDLRRKHDDADLLHSSLQARVNINCIDYNATQVKLQEGITNETLQQFLDTPRPEWSRVRWINIDGMSWDVIQSCALHFDLHPLCVEDCVHIPQRIKADFYDHFLYVSLNLVSLEYMGLQNRDSDEGCPEAVVNNGASSKKGKQAREERPLQQGMRSNTSSSSSFQPQPGKTPVKRLLSSSNLPGNIAAGMSEKGRTAMTTTPRAVEVAAEQVSIFLLQDNTIISMFQTDGSSVTRPLWAQLREPRTLARDAEDASYLLNLLLDAIVDSAFPVVEAFADLIGAYESCVLERQPRPSNTRDLHVVTGDLATLRRTIQPTYNLVTALRAHAQASQEALGTMPGHPMHISPFSQAPGYAPATSDSLTELAAPHVAAGGERGMLKDERDEHEAHGQTVHDNALFRSPGGHHAPSSSCSPSASSSPRYPNMPHHQHTHNQHPFRPLSPHAMQQKVLISRLTKTYLSDVQDHLSSTLDSINSLSEQCRDLIALIFNLAAHQTNQSMQALTVVSVLFLPLTFLAGIYGMNFDNIPELHWEYGYLYFYGMALCTVAVFVIVMARMGLLSTTG